MRLKEIRNSRNITQLKLSNDLQMSRSTYNGYENKISEPDIETLKKIADYYGVSLDYLCEHETKGELQLGYLRDDQKELVKIIASLSQWYCLQIKTFVMGLQINAQ